MDGWIAGFLAVLILAVGGIALGLFALYRKHKAEIKQDNL